jgi:hypothetical protein
MQCHKIFFITVDALPVSDGETAQNMQSVDNNKEQCIMLHLVLVLKRMYLCLCNIKKVMLSLHSHLVENWH